MTSSISPAVKAAVLTLNDSCEERGFPIIPEELVLGQIEKAAQAALSLDSVFSEPSVELDKIAAPVTQRSSVVSNASSNSVFSNDSRSSSKEATPAATPEITTRKELREVVLSGSESEPAPVELTKQQKIEIEDAKNKKQILMLRMKRFGISLSLIPEGAIALALGAVTSPLVCAFSEKIKNREITYNNQIAKKRTLIQNFEKELISCSNEERIEFIKNEIARLKKEIKNQRGLVISQVLISALVRNSFQGLARTMLKRQYITSSAIPEIKEQINREDSLKAMNASAFYLPKKEVSLSKKFSMFMLNRAVNADKDRMPLTNMKTLEVNIKLLSGEAPFYKSSVSENAKRFIPFSELRQWIKRRRSNNS